MLRPEPSQSVMAGPVGIGCVPSVMAAIRKRWVGQISVGSEMECSARCPGNFCLPRFLRQGHLLEAGGVSPAGAGTAITVNDAAFAASASFHARRKPVALPDSVATLG